MERKTRLYLLDKKSDTVNDSSELIIISKIGNEVKIIPLNNFM